VRGLRTTAVEGVRVPGLGRLRAHTVELPGVHRVRGRTGAPTHGLARSVRLLTYRPLFRGVAPGRVWGHGESLPFPKQTETPGRASGVAGRAGRRADHRRRGGVHGDAGGPDGAPAQRVRVAARVDRVGHVGEHDR